MPSLQEKLDRIGAAHAYDGDLDDADETPDDAWRAQRWTRSIPSRFLWATIEDFTDPAKPDFYAPTIAADIAAWAQHPQGNLLIFGPVGVGKTHAAVAAARARFFDAYADVRFHPLVELLDLLRPDGSEDAQIMRKLCEIDLLVIDDLGSERPTDWTAERMYALINRRWLNEQPTIFTTNLWPTKAAADNGATGTTLDEVVGPRVFSRLVGSDALVLRMTGPDRRRAR